jgi:hypothetical protein
MSNAKRLPSKESSMKALHQSDLKAAQCDQGGCTHEDHKILYLHPTCHKAQTWTQYDHGDGTLRVECGECGRALAMFQVAP